MAVPERRPQRMCVRCERFSPNPVVVSEVHAGSGPGFNVYACTACAPYYPAPPDVLDLFEPRDRNGRRESDRPAD